MKTKTTVFYDDMETESFDITKAWLFADFAELEGWESEDDVPDSVVYREMAESRQREWDDFKADMEYVLKTDTFLLTGTCGRWDGPAEGGKFILKFEDLADCIRHLDRIKVYDENGHFFISGYHHDGSDHYELRRLTNKGFEFADKNYFAHDRALHTTIMTNNLFSGLPRLAERLYGVV